MIIRKHTQDVEDEAAVTEAAGGDTSFKINAMWKEIGLILTEWDEVVVSHICEGVSENEHGGGMACCCTFHINTELIAH